MLFSKKDLNQELDYVNKLLGEIKNESIKKRMSNIVIWYVRGAHIHRGRYLASIVVVSILNAAIPVLVLCHQADVIDIIIAGLSSMSGLLMILRGYYKWHDNWLNNRRNSEIIKSKMVLYVNGVKPYDGKDADQLFLKEIENNITDDGNKWYETRSKQ